MIKLIVAVLVGGLAFFGIERYAMKDKMLFGQFDFPTDDAGLPRLSLGYFVMGGAIVLVAVGVGMGVHKVSGGRLPAGVSLAGK
jgi:hypothetical protein